ncbi:VanZ family protein [Paenibacillus sp. R14(2021)]|uniref:VanZ family protein n=1 Tax=Paenibacillus sp. R14(2021) TaxID=2859228 RepID=UPI001C611F73|nr:VanZ family protein [Paenibacillus sp. R14(2021)]
MNAKRFLTGLIIRALLAIYLYALFKIILFKFRVIDAAYLREQLMRSLTHPGYVRSRIEGSNLTPFKEIDRTIHELSPYELAYLIGNIALFVPFGVILGLLFASRKLSLLCAFLYSLGLSLVLEGSQAVFAIGSFDVDDLLLNALGGLMGCALFKFWTAATRTEPSDLQDEQTIPEQAAGALHVQG